MERVDQGVQTSHRVILAGVAGAAFLGPFTQTVYTPNLPELQRFFEVNTVLINLTISLFTAILAASNFVIGPLADTLGRRAVLLPGLLLFSAGSLLCLASDSYGWFLAGRSVQAAGISAALLVAPTVIGDTYAPDARAQAMSVYQTVTFLGPVFGPLIGGASLRTPVGGGPSPCLPRAVLARGLSTWLISRRRCPIRQSHLG